MKRNSPFYRPRYATPIPTRAYDLRSNSLQKIGKKSRQKCDKRRLCLVFCTIMSISKCPVCGVLGSPDAIYCSKCGEDINPSSSAFFCIRCGQTLDDNANYCAYCRAPVPYASGNSKDKRMILRTQVYMELKELFQNK